VLTTPRGLCSTIVRRSGATCTGSPSTAITSRRASARVPSSRTTRPLTVTRPATMSASACRRDATPAALRIFWRRSAAS